MTIKEASTAAVLRTKMFQKTEEGQKVIYNQPRYEKLYYKIYCSDYHCFHIGGNCIFLSIYPILPFNFAFYSCLFLHRNKPCTCLFVKNCWKIKFKVYLTIYGHKFYKNVFLFGCCHRLCDYKKRGCKDFFSQLFAPICCLYYL